ncbi:aspartate ammonia-lyase [Pseudomaricurvus alkylphenolicus]|jgi:aspartate ammonia-lyase|uniref:aspartate ammonia-lyase n=1 Tax=Pseudomaricurvus alkylphenolicus TaxID=1306991 RepID=UPI00141F7DA7|nr:aspartate ammonia-lyase [Pseudomaricurvus alkylphenolicus]NIB41088.1 aspartate ammonia-lyase [Pseudomaricurvus alkylphenolicus]
MNNAAQNATGGFRTEHDLLGEAKVPVSAYYGIQTQRAKDNFDIAGVPISHYPELINALAMVKLAAARANHQLGLLEDRVAGAIDSSCADIMEGQLHDQFVVDIIQGGAGTSTNMNANEVIANLALEKLGHAKGEYQYLHPNNHVNLSQSTNDAYPTALRLAIILATMPLQQTIAKLQESFDQKAQDFSGILKMGRTQLQDAVPMSLGQEFRAYSVTLTEDHDRIGELAGLLAEVNLGGTAIGTGLNTHPDYARIAVEHLNAISGQPMKLAGCLVEATSDMGAFVLFSSMLKRLAVKLSKICNDLRLLSSGPRAGLNEINLPPMQPGSSIMPGKVNPVIPEAVNQMAFEVIGNDVAVTLAAEAGQLQLNAMEPLIGGNILQSMKMLQRAMVMLTERCVDGITANPSICQGYINNSIGVVAALNPVIGYEHASRIAKRALAEDRGIIELVLEERLMDEKHLNSILKPENMLAPSL